MEGHLPICVELWTSSHYRTAIGSTGGYARYGNISLQLFFIIVEVRCHGINSAVRELGESSQLEFFVLIILNVDNAESSHPQFLGYYRI